MPRDLTTGVVTAITAKRVRAAFLASIAFASETAYLWTGVGDFSWNGMSFKGLGSLAEVSTVSEGSDVQAEGIHLTLSGIDSHLMGDALSEIQLGLPATVYFALFDENMNLIPNPAVAYRGLVDQPSISISGESMTISLAIENRFINMGRAQFSRYTSAEQHRFYPGDNGFFFVESLANAAFRWQ
jgi:hypothetical protein